MMLVAFLVTPLLGFNTMPTSYIYLIALCFIAVGLALTMCWVIIGMHVHSAIVACVGALL